jgi:hypothetical protein
MTARIGTMSVDGTPISEADVARIEADEKLHAEQQRSAVRVVASAAHDADDCRLLLSALGIERETVLAARAKRRRGPGKRSGRRPAA